MKIRKIGTFLLALGIDPRKIYFSICGLPQYVIIFFRICNALRNGELKDFKIRILPIWSDALASSGTAKGHYFHQDLWAARRIHSLKPSEHIDVGSRVDGFVAHLLTFMNVTVIDVRPLISKVPGLTFIQRNMMNTNGSEALESESVSCLHALEHFGLGRYGDPFDLDGWRKGMVNLSLIVKEGGRLYLSVPIGPQVVEFNAHRIFEPGTIINEAEKLGLSLYEFSFIGDDGEFNPAVTINNANGCQFGCGCFEFIKLNSSLE